MSERRFPPPWTVETIPGGLKVCDANGQSRAYVYSSENPNVAKVLTKDEARRIASNITRAPNLKARIQLLCKGTINPENLKHPPGVEMGPAPVPIIGYDVLISLSSLDINDLSPSSLGKANGGLSCSILSDHAVTSVATLGSRATYVATARYSVLARTVPQNSQPTPQQFCKALAGERRTQAHPHQ